MTETTTTTLRSTQPQNDKDIYIATNLKCYRVM